MAKSSERPHEEVWVTTSWHGEVVWVSGLRRGAELRTGRDFPSLPGLSDGTVLVSRPRRQAYVHVAQGAHVRRDPWKDGVPPEAVVEGERLPIRAGDRVVLVLAEGDVEVSVELFRSEANLGLGLRSWLPSPFVVAVALAYALSLLGLAPAVSHRSTEPETTSREDVLFMRRALAARAEREAEDLAPSGTQTKRSVDEGRHAEPPGAATVLDEPLTRKSIWCVGSVLWPGSFDREVEPQPRRETADLGWTFMCSGALKGFAPHGLRLSWGISIVHGPLPADVLQWELRVNEGRLRACYEAGLVSDPSLEARVMVIFEINPDGSVSVFSGGRHASLLECILGVTSGLFLPRTDGVVTVTYSLELSKVRAPEPT